MSSCAYVGVQDKKDSLDIESKAVWWQANLIASYQFTKSVSLAGRIEYFNDLKSVQVVPITSVKGFDSFSGGLCINVKVGDNALFRLEGRSFFSERKMFIGKNNEETNWSNLLITNLTVWF